MQLVLSNNRIIAHGENFLAMGGVVINTETGAKYENATIAECEGCPSDINEVGYEYHAGVFVPCAPFGKGNNNGYFMEVCKDCATPRNSGIPIKGGLGRENLSIFPLLWENASPTSNFGAITIPLTLEDYVGFVIVAASGTSNTTPRYGAILSNYIGSTVEIHQGETRYRTATITSEGIAFDTGFSDGSIAKMHIIPLKIYGVKL